MLKSAERHDFVKALTRNMLFGLLPLIFFGTSSVDLNGRFNVSYISEVSSCSSSSNHVVEAKPFFTCYWLIQCGAPCDVGMHVRVRLRRVKGPIHVHRGGPCIATIPSYHF